MNDFLLSLFLGIIEGLTEFLPVSSTAHLRLSEAFLGVDLGSGYWKMYSIVIQLGAILCLPIYFRSRIVGIRFHISPRLRSQAHDLESPSIAHSRGLRRHRGPGIPAHESHRKKSRERAHHGVFADHRRSHHVGGGRHLWQTASTEFPRRHAKLQNRKHGRDELLAGGVDRVLPDFLGGFPRNLTLNVHHCRRTDHRDVAAISPGIFLLRVYTYNAGSNLLRFIQVFPSQTWRYGYRHCAGQWPSVGSVNSRICSVVHRGLCGSCMVYELGTPARICTLCYLSDSAGDRGAVLGGKNHHALKLP